MGLSKRCNNKMKIVSTIFYNLIWYKQWRIIMVAGRPWPPKNFEFFFTICIFIFLL